MNLAGNPVSQVWILKQWSSLLSKYSICNVYFSFNFFWYQRLLLFTVKSQPQPQSQPPSLLLPTPNPTALSVVLFLWLIGWSCHIWCAILLNDIMDPHMSNLGTSVPEGPWCVFYVTRHQVNWGLTNVTFCWCSDLISHKHTNTHTAHSGTTFYVLTAAIFITLNE